MVKAMHDRELLMSAKTGKSKTRHKRRLGPRDRKILQRSAHYARFAAASYDGVIDTMKELAEEDIFPPPGLFSQRYGGRGGGERRRGAAAFFFFGVLLTEEAAGARTPVHQRSVFDTTICRRAL